MIQCGECSNRIKFKNATDAKISNTFYQQGCEGRIGREAMLRKTLMNELVKKKI